MQVFCGVPCTAAGDLKPLPIMCLHLMIWKTHKVRKMDCCPVLFSLPYMVSTVVTAWLPGISLYVSIVKPGISLYVSIVKPGISLYISIVKPIYTVPLYNASLVPRPFHPRR